MKPIRHLTSDDYRTVCSILTTCGLVSPTFSEAFTVRAFSKLLVASSPGVCLAHDPYILRNDPAGIVLASHDGIYGHIYKLAVLPEYRRRGIGMELFLCAVDMLERNGIRQIFAHVAKDNPASIALLGKVGFKIRETHFLVDNLPTVSQSK